MMKMLKLRVVAIASAVCFLGQPIQVSALPPPGTRVFLKWEVQRDNFFKVVAKGSYALDQFDSDYYPKPGAVGKVIKNYKGTYKIKGKVIFNIVDVQWDNVKRSQNFKIFVNPDDLQVISLERSANPLLKKGDIVCNKGVVNGLLTGKLIRDYFGGQKVTVKCEINTIPVQSEQRSPKGSERSAVAKGSYTKDWKKRDNNYIFVWNKSDILKCEMEPLLKGFNKRSTEKGDIVCYFGDTIYDDRDRIIAEAGTNARVFLDYFPTNKKLRSKVAVKFDNSYLISQLVDYNDLRREILTEYTPSLHKRGCVVYSRSDSKTIRTKGTFMRKCMDTWYNSWNRDYVWVSWPGEARAKKVLLAGLEFVHYERLP